MESRPAPPPYEASQANYGQPVHLTIHPQPQPQPPPNTVIVTHPTVIHIGRCPACQVGVLNDNFTCLGIFCAIFFFPIGILCCLMMTEKRCTNCGAHFG